MVILSIARDIGALRPVETELCGLWWDEDRLRRRIEPVIEDRVDEVELVRCRLSLGGIRGRGVVRLSGEVVPEDTLEELDMILCAT